MYVICKILILSEDVKISDALGASSQLELTHTSPTNFHQDSPLNCDALVIDTNILRDLSHIDFSKISQPIIFITEAEQNQEKQDVNFDSSNFLTLSELTANSLLGCIFQNLKKTSLEKTSLEKVQQITDPSLHQQAIKVNQDKLTTIIQDLPENQSFLNAVLNQIPNPVFIKDAELRFVAYNKAFESNFIPEGNWLGKTLLDIKQNVYKNPKTVHEGQLKLLEQNSSYSKTYHVNTINDVELDIIGTVSAFKFNNGSKEQDNKKQGSKKYGNKEQDSKEQGSKEQGLIGIIQDISQLKTTERKLAESLQHTESINSKLELLNQLSLDLVQLQNLDEILDIVCKQTKMLLEADRTTVVLIPESNIPTKLYIHDEDFTGYKAFNVTKMNKVAAIVNQVIASKKCVTFSNNELNNNSRLAQKGLKSFIASPIIIDGKVVATLNAASVSNTVYSKKAQLWLQQITSLVSIALQKQSFLEQTQTALSTTEFQKQRFSKLNKLTQNLMVAPSHEAICTMVLNELPKLLDTDFTTFSFFTEDNTSLKTYQTSKDGKRLEPTGRTWPIENVSLGEAISQRKIIHSDFETSHYLDCQMILQFGLRSGMAAPLIVEDKVLGTINVTSKQPKAFTEQDEAFMLQVASLAAATIENKRLFEEQLTIAVENANLHEQVLNNLKQKEALFTISQLLRSSTNIQASIEEVMEILAKALNARWLFHNNYASAIDSSKPMPFLADYAQKLVLRNAPITDYIPTYTNREETIAYRCIRDKTPLLLQKSDLLQESPTIQKAFKSRGAASTLMSPIYDSYNKNTVIGSLGVTREENQEDFTQADLNFLVSVNHQISTAESQHKLSKQVQFQAFHDALTSLPNRNLFEKRLTQEMEFASEKDTCVGLLFLDLDGFKYINDTFGHDVGDQLLNLVSERLDNKTRYIDTLARMGGDEFTIILSEIDSLDQAVELATDYLQVFQTPFDLENKPIVITASIGLSIFPEDGQTVSVLLKHADIAMYLAKAQGKNGIQIFSQELADRTKEHLLLENNLRLAVDNKEFVLHYQPQYSLTTGALIGTEALIRWNHPENGLIAPNRFIPIAEETLLIIAMGQWALNQACQQTALWHKQGQKITVAVNVAAAQFVQPNFIETVVKALETSKLDAQYLELEVTESVVMDNIDLVANRLQELRDLGVSIALDDFGTGFSSLQYLQNLPFDKLKIDRSFIMNIGTVPNDSRDKVLVKNIMQLATGFELKVIAEGIETLQQAEYLKDLGCHYVQGFYYAKPVTANEVFSKNPVSDEIDRPLIPAKHNIVPIVN